MEKLVLLVLFLTLGRTGFCEVEEVCSKSQISSCSDCIRSGPFCVWCQQPNFIKAGEQEAVRCDTRQKLLKGGCSEENIVTISNSQSVEKNDPLSATFDLKEPVQLAPQRVSLRVRPGLPITFPVYFKRVQGYPVDLYYLMDLSYSMKDDLQNVKVLGEDLFTTLKKITEHGRIGFGAFVDKTVLPYTNTNPEKLRKPCDDSREQCQAAFGYRHVLSLTPSQEEFNDKVKEQFISGNLDTPEGSLDAMMQATVCGDQIGWRNRSTRLIVLTTDAGFHMAGDGKLAGILDPNDEQCHMKSDVYSKSDLYSKSSEMDYPSVGQLALQLEKHNIQPIFAVTQNVFDVYKQLSKLIPKSEVGILSSDSGNVVKLIEDAYNKLSSKVTLTHDVLPENIRVSYKPKCEHPLPSGESAGVCDNVRVNQQISFDVTVTAEACLEPQTFSISPLGIKDSLSVSVSADCDCHCSDSSENSTSHCNNQGKVHCGICKCDKGFLGQFCNCSENRVDGSLRAQCVRQDGPECEGRGDCICGRCECHKKPSGISYRGAFCECDDEQCELFQNKLCGGNGKCRCGECQCDPEFGGSACQCRRSKDSCRTQDGSVCNGRGNCTCDRCECDSGYQPPLCLTCPSCLDPCLTKLSCIECLGFDIGPFKHNCSSACSSVSHHMVEHLSSLKQCEQKDSDGCWVRFGLKQLVGKDNYTVEILRSRDCPPSVTAIIAASIASVAFIGILLLLIVKFVIYMNDLKDFRKFEEEKKKKSKWAEANNPLFKNATTTTSNPTFTGE